MNSQIESGYVQYCLSFYNCTTNVDNLIFWVQTGLGYIPAPVPTLRDMTIAQSANGYMWDADVLLSGQYYTPSGVVDQSVVYEFPYGPSGYTLTSGHVHDNVYLTSLDVTEDNHLISSGYHSSANNAFFDKFHLGHNPSCLDYTDQGMNHEKIGHRKLYPQYSLTAISQLPHTWELENKIMEIVEECVIMTDTDDDENER